MKARVLVAALSLLFSFGCARPQSEELTPQQKDKVKSEAKAASDSVIARWVRRDGGGAMEYYAPDVVVVSDTMKMDYKTYRQGWIAYDSAAAAIKVTPRRDEGMVLAKDIVVWTWVGKVEITMQSGDTVTTDPQVYSSVMQKVAGRWLVIYSHASGVGVVHKAGPARRPKA